MGDLHVPEQDGRTREVPVLGERREILLRLHAQANYPSGQRLYELAKAKFFWAQLKQDCEEVARHALAN